MLVSVIMVSLTNSRMQSRDTKRLADMNQIKSGLDLYYLHAGGYPTDAQWVPGTDLMCGSTFIMRIPQDALSGYTYEYSTGGYASPGCGGSTQSNYYVSFTTELETHLGPADEYYLHPGGITATPPF